MCPNAMDNAQVEEYSDEQVAAAALASLTYGGFATAQSAMDGDNPTRGASHEKTSDLDEVSTTPHTLTDYSSIREIDLAMLAYYTDDHTLHGSLSVYPPVLRKAWMERILDLQRLFYDCGTTRKNSGGVLQPFPEKVSVYIFFARIFAAVIHYCTCYIYQYILFQVNGSTRQVRIRAYCLLDAAWSRIHSQGTPAIRP
jgi:hypothetical protein